MRLISETPRFPILVSFVVHAEKQHHEGFPQVIHCSEQWEEEKRKTLFGEPILGYNVWDCQTLKTYDAAKTPPAKFPCRVSFWDNGAGDGGWPGVVVNSLEEFQKEHDGAYNFSLACSGCSWETGYCVLPLAPTGSKKDRINGRGRNPRSLANLAAHHSRPKKRTTIQVAVDNADVEVLGLPTAKALAQDAISRAAEDMRGRPDYGR